MASTTVRRPLPALIALLALLLLTGIVWWRVINRNDAEDSSASCPTSTPTEHEGANGAPGYGYTANVINNTLFACHGIYIRSSKRCSSILHLSNISRRGRLREQYSPANLTLFQSDFHLHVNEMISVSLRTNTFNVKPSNVLD